jgi:hypothetical protein
MNFSLGRFGTFLWGTILLSLIIFAIPILLYFFHDQTIGTVVGVESNVVSGRRGSHMEFREIIDYSVGPEKYTFKTGYYRNANEVGSRVKVIYSTLFHSDAYTNSIASMAQIRAIIWIILLFPWFAFSTSFIGKNERLTFRDRKLRLEKASALRK